MQRAGEVIGLIPERCSNSASPLASRGCILPRGHLHEDGPIYHYDGNGHAWSDDGVVTFSGFDLPQLDAHRGSQP